MFVAFMALVLIASVPLLGGRLGALSALSNVKQQPLLLLALLLQILITVEFVGLWHPLLVAVHLVTYVMAAVFLWANRRIPGLLVIAAGAAMNGVTIALNGGTLPARASALAAAGIHVKPGDFTNSGILAHPHLGWLGDIVATPSWLPFRNVLSIGDVVVLVGLAILLHVTCRTLPVRLLARDTEPTPVAVPQPEMA